MSALPERIALLFARSAGELSSDELLELALDASERGGWDLVYHPQHLVAVCHLAIAAMTGARLDAQARAQATARAEVAERERDQARALLRDRNASNDSNDSNDRALVLDRL